MLLLCTDKVPYTKSHVQSSEYSKFFISTSFNAYYKTCRSTATSISFDKRLGTTVHLTSKHLSANKKTLSLGTVGPKNTNER